VPYANDLARPFFANLLPEAEIRRVIARSLGISEKNDFILLRKIGGVVGEIVQGLNILCGNCNHFAN
jgi:HipA-like protein